MSRVKCAVRLTDDDGMHAGDNPRLSLNPRLRDNQGLFPLENSTAVCQVIYSSLLPKYLEPLSHENECRTSFSDTAHLQSM